MEPMSWAAIAPLVDKVNREGRTLIIVFRCPETGEKVSTQSTMQSAADRVLPVLGRQMASQTQYNLRKQLAQGLRGALGGGFLGSVAHEVAWQGTQGAATATRRDVVYTEDDQREAIVRGFGSIQQHFRWEGQWRWAASTPARPVRPASAAIPTSQRAFPTTAPGALAQPASPEPTAAPADLREVTLRAIVEVAMADKNLGPAELELGESLDLVPAQVTALQARPLDAADAASLSDRDRQHVYQMAAAMAYADTQLTRDESTKLDRLAGVLGLSRSQRSELDRLAREHLLELLVREAWQGREPTSAEQNGLRNQALRWGVPPIRLDQITARVRGT